jgi:sugar phosphate isomerase/epimerase
MKKEQVDRSRRQVVKSLAVAGIGLSGIKGISPMNSSPGIAQFSGKLGFDNFSIRALKWKAPQLLDYAAKVKVDVVLFSDLDVYERREESYLLELKAKAKELGIEMQAGTGSICPTSNTFPKNVGTAEEHLATTIRIAHTLGSPVARCYLGNAADRMSSGGIEARIADTINVLRKTRSLAKELGVKIAVENHAGDMRASELLILIDGAGRDFVGATLDSGNAVWALEDPHQNMLLLKDVALTTGIRDSAVWETKDGAAVMWTAMGDGKVDWQNYFALLFKVNPTVPIILEIISNSIRQVPYLDTKFWGAYQSLKASELMPFLALAKRGAPRTELPLPAERDGLTPMQLFQLEQLEKSIAYCKSLGLGVKR